MEEKKGGVTMKEKRSALGYSNKLEYINEYQKEKYDRMNLTVAKGLREQYKAEADKRGLTVSKMFTTAVDEWLSRN
jgi:hypothetical protein